MKAKKWLSLFMATAMTATLAVGFAGCDPTKPDDEEPEDPPVTWTDPNNYYLVGDGKGTLALSHWDQTADIPELKFTKGANNTYTIDAELYEGDEFGIIFNFAWAGQKGFNNMTIANEGKDAAGNAVFVSGGGYDVKNIAVAEGASGLYELKMVSNKVPQQPDFSWTLKEKIEVVTVTFYGEDGEVIKTESVKKGSTFTPEALESDKLFYVFDGWYTAAEEGEKFTSGEVTGDLELHARFAEEQNDGFVEDTREFHIVGAAADAESESSLNEITSWTPTDETLKFTKDSAYTQHNVYTLEMTLFAGDQFKLLYETGWDHAIGIGALQEPGATFVGSDNIELANGMDGVYVFTLVTDGAASAKIYWECTEFFGDMPVYYLTGTYVTNEWLDDYDDDSTIMLMETEEGSGVFAAVVTITEEMYPAWSADQSSIGLAAAIKVKNHETTDDFGIGDGNGTAGTNNVWLKAGTYYITFDEATGVITYEAYAYYIVGSFWDGENENNFVLVEGLTPVMTDNGDGTFTAELEIADVSDHFSWIVGGVFALKVVYGCMTTGVVATWIGVDGGDANVIVPAAGTYTITFDANAMTITCTLSE